MLEPTSLQVSLKFPVNMLGQGSTLVCQLLNQGRVMRLDDLIEERLLGPMAFAAGAGQAEPSL